MRRILENKNRQLVRKLSRKSKAGCQEFYQKLKVGVRVIQIIVGYQSTH